MTTHSSILAWRIPWTEEPGGLSPMGSKRSDVTEQQNPATACESTVISNSKLQKQSKMNGDFSEKESGILTEMSHTRPEKVRWT